MKKYIKPTYNHKSRPMSGKYIIIPRNGSRL